MACAVRSTCELRSEKHPISRVRSKQQTSSEIQIKQLFTKGFAAPTTEPSHTGCPDKSESRLSCAAAPISQRDELSRLTNSLPIIPEDFVVEINTRTHSIPLLPSATGQITSVDHGHKVTDSHTTRTPKDPNSINFFRQLQHITASAVARIPSFPRTSRQFPQPSTSTSICDTSINSPSSSSNSSADNTSLYTTISAVPSSSITSSRTSVDCESVFLNIDSPAIYRWADEHNLFIGKARECPPPFAMNMKWTRNIRSRLLGDLISILQSLPRSLPREKTIIEPELCMMGRRDDQSTTVEMKPAILIRCGSKRCQKAVANAVEDLEYLQSFSKRQIVVQRRPPRPACDSRDAGSSSPEPVEPQNDAISIEVGITAAESACGLQIICRYLGEERMSTLGGLVRIDDRVYGLTTAHAMVSLDNLSNPNTNSSSELDSEDETSSSVSSISSCTTPPQTAEVTRLSIKEEISVDVVRPHVRSWASLSLGPYSYATQRQPSSTNNAYPVSNSSDFALIELSKELSDLPNAYVLPGLEQDGTETVTTIGTPSLDDIDSSVSILCSPTDARQGYLLPGEHLFLDRASVFCTRKIQLNEPLQRGSSGAWVVQGSKLVGMIVAVYDDEPYAHMLDITSVFSDIRALLSDGEHIPSVGISVQETVTVSPQEKNSSVDEPLVADNGVEDSTGVPRSGLHNIMLTRMKEFLQRLWEKARFKHRRSRKISYDTVPDSVALIHKITLGAAVLACFCIYMDNIMFPFIFPDISDSFSSFRHLGIYVGSYRLFGNFMRPFLEMAYSRWSTQRLMILALVISQAGWLVSGLAQNSWVFASGRALSGIGSVGVMTGSILYTSAIGFNEGGSCHKRYLRFLAAAKWTSALIGPFVAGAAADRSKWRWCLVLLMVLNACAIVTVISVHRKITFRLSPFLPSYRKQHCSISVTHICSHLLTTAFSLSLIVYLSYHPLHTWEHRAAFLVPLVIAIVTLGLSMILSLVRRWIIGFRAKNAPPWFLISVIACLAIISHISVPVVLVYLPFWLQMIKGVSVLTSATYLLAATIPQYGCGIAIRSRVRAWRIPAVPIISMSLVAIGSGLLQLMQPSSPAWHWAIFLLIFGCGAGLSVSRYALLHALGPHIPDMSETSFDYFIFVGRFCLWREHAVAIGTALAHMLFLLALQSSFLRSSIPDFEHIQRGGASAWKDARFEVYKSNLAAPYNEALKWAFGEATAASVFAVVLAFAVYVTYATSAGSRYLLGMDSFFKERSVQKLRSDAPLADVLASRQRLDEVHASKHRPDDEKYSLVAPADFDCNPAHTSDGHWKEGSTYDSEAHQNPGQAMDLDLAGLIYAIAVQDREVQQHTLVTSEWTGLNMRRIKIFEQGLR